MVGVGGRWRRQRHLAAAGGEGGGKRRVVVAGGYDGEQAAGDSVRWSQSAEGGFQAIERGSKIL